MAIKDLTTEQRNPASMHIDTVSTAEMVKIMNEEDKKGCHRCWYSRCSDSKSN